MSNGDPDAITDSLASARDAFEHQSGGIPTPESGINTDDTWKTQLTKACKLLEVVTTLQQQNGYYTAMIELSFGTIERSIEAYLLAMTGNVLEDFQDHTYVYRQADQAGLFSHETASGLESLYADNRTDSYYAEQRPTEEQATEMIEIARGVHDYVGDQIRRGNACTCA